VNQARPRIAVVGNPNTGKSTLFNCLTGMRQKVGNYPGVTVEEHVGLARLGNTEVELVDVPGTYSLAAHSPDEMLAIDLLTGSLEGYSAPDAVLIVVDASNLRRNLFFATQVLELGLPSLVVLNMSDVAQSKGQQVNVAALRRLLQVNVVEVSARSGNGLAGLKKTLAALLNDNAQSRSQINLLPEVQQAAEQLSQQPAFADCNRISIERALLDCDSYAAQRIVDQNSSAAQQLQNAQNELQASNQQTPLAALEAQRRYSWIDKHINSLVNPLKQQQRSLADRLDEGLARPLIGSLGFIAVMATVFQAVFAWAVPFMDLIDGGTSAVGGWLGAQLPDGALNSLLVDGVIAGVGSVIIFLPQILILFAFILLLEDIGYMARAAFMMDRLMRWCGLSGQSFIPMLSSFACAVPGIMATRVIPERKDRIATILAAPFMTCSARLPVYALLIGAFVPHKTWLGGLVNLPGLVLLGLYFLGIFGGIFTAWLFKKTLLRGPTPPFLLELPPFRKPNWRSFLINLSERAIIFLRRAGGVIFAVTIIVWGATYFPRNADLESQRDTQLAALAAQQLDAIALEQASTDIENQYAAAHLNQSLLGRAGHAVEPIFKPLGWDWKVAAGVLASFPAREVVVAVLGTIYAVGADADETDQTLIDRLRSATWPDGRPVFTIGMAIGLLVFYAFCLQCMATVATMRRETGGWRWPLIAWTYMTALGYVGALLCYQLIG
jgi:ferrous iron transport protein B